MNESTWVVHVLKGKGKKRGKHIQLLNLPCQGALDLSRQKLCHTMDVHHAMLVLSGYAHGTFHWHHKYHLVHKTKQLPNEKPEIWLLDWPKSGSVQVQVWVYGEPGPGPLGLVRFRFRLGSDHLVAKK